jgi:hypothetical protein
MKKLILIVIFVLAAATLAQAAEEVGTYKLVLGNGKNEVYKINTKTGQTWVSTEIAIYDVTQLTYYWGPMSPEDIKKWELTLKAQGGKAQIRIWQSLDEKSLLPVQ